MCVMYVCTHVMYAMSVMYAMYVCNVCNACSVCVCYSGVRNVMQCDAMQCGVIYECV